MRETIKLFKAIPIKKHTTKVKVDVELIKLSVEKGYVFSPEIYAEFSKDKIEEFIRIIDTEFGLDAKQLNSTFHKSWNKIKIASLTQLYIEQILHYFTTYGFEALGIYNEESVYIPNEKLDIPEYKGDEIKLTVIKSLTKDELKTKLIEFLQTGIALKEDTINDCFEVANFVEINDKEVELIKNKEVKIKMYKHLGLVPEQPVEFLRYIVSLKTDSTLLIKNAGTIARIKDSIVKVEKIFKAYETKYTLARLAEIFYRYKPLFLALKSEPKLAKSINKIRKLAIKYHKPMQEDFLNSITDKIANGKLINPNELKKELSKVNIFRKIRLAYALKFRTKDVESILYRVRNGKGYAKEFNFRNQNFAKSIFKVVRQSIINDIEKNVKGKKIYIPEHIKYALPATEKQFTGYVPSGSYIQIPKDMVVGVHWGQGKDSRIDLDLSLINQTEGKIGWNTRYRNDDRTILFSGDMTSAPQPNGATELFYVRKQLEESFILNLCYYNYDESHEVPYNIVVAKEQVSNMKQNYMVNPNNVVAIVKSKINVRQKVLGLLTTTTNECRFYFTETELGKSNVSASGPLMEHTRKYLFNFYKNSIDFKKILEKAGAIVVNEIDDKEEIIDLSPEQLEKDTIINLIK